MVRTKIICTLGPASSGETTLRKMMLAGMDVARLNFSHAKPDGLIRTVDLLRRLNAKYRRRMRILGDLQGHRIRIGRLAGGKPVALAKRRSLRLVQGDIEGTDSSVSFDYLGPLRPIRAGSRIFIDDGTIVLEVVGHEREALKTRVVVGGLLKEHKGVNIPDARLTFGGLSDQDRKDIAFSEEQDFDYVAQSFVRSKKDVLEVRQALSPHSPCRVFAKIENRDGIRNIDQIITAADGVMIARGDMGVSVPVYEVPLIQKMIIRKCNRAGKPVITATQMLESMTESRMPTRAEVTDVANAILDGTDFVMLSAESAVGKYPVETVAMMNNIIRFTERHGFSQPEEGPGLPGSGRSRRVARKPL